MLILNTGYETAATAAAIFLETVGESKKHKHYKRTVEYAELCLQLMTGEGMEKLLSKFYKEDPESWKQRKAITQYVTTSVAGNLGKPFNKLFTSPSIQKIIASDDKEQLKELHEILRQFWGGSGGYEEWYQIRWTELNFIDPNTYVVFDWSDFDPAIQRAEPYPVEYRSPAVLNFRYDRNYLQWLFVQDNDKRYIFYGKDQTVIIQQMPEDFTTYLIEGHAEIDETGNGYIKIKNKIYRIKPAIPHNLDKVPAFVVGYNRNEATNGETYLSPIDDAFPILIKSVSTGSELDLAIRLHVFPQKLQYMPPCSNTECRDGRLSDGGVCPVCKGTGRDVHTSSADIISLNLPMTKEEMIALSELIHYVQLPIEVINFLDTYIKTLYNQAKEAVFNSDIFTRQQIAETATGQNIAIQNLYDSLYPMAVDYASKWKWGIDLIAQITDLDNGLKVAMSFGRDFKLKTLDDLYSELRTVTDSGASSFIKSAVEKDIARVVYIDNEIGYSKYLTLQAFDPFSGKSQQEILALLSSNNTTQYNKVLYSNINGIFDEIEQEHPDFYLWTRDKQRVKIDEKVNLLLAEIKAQTPALPTFQSFGK